MIVSIPESNPFNILNVPGDEFIVDTGYGPARAEGSRAKEGTAEVMTAQAELIVLVEGIKGAAQMVFEFDLAVLVIFLGIFHMTYHTIIIRRRPAQMIG